MTQINILLVDDDRDYFILVKRMLAQLSSRYVVEWQSNYIDGLKTILQHRHDVYLLDNQIGRRSGLDLVREAIDANIDAPFIIVTGQSEIESGLHALRSGATDFIEKVAAQPAELQRAIEQALVRVELARKQREHEVLYRALVDESPDSILVTDLDGQIIYVNPAASDLTNLPLENLLSRSIEDVIQPRDQNLSLLGNGNIDGMNATLNQDNVINDHFEVSARHIHDQYRQFIIRDTSRHRRSIEKRDRHIEQLTILRRIDEELSQITNIDAVLTLASDACARLGDATAGYIALQDSNRHDLVKVAEIVGKTGSLHSNERIAQTPLLHTLLETGEAMLITSLANQQGLPLLRADSCAQMLIPLTSHESVMGILHLETKREDAFTQELFNFLKLVANRIGVAIENAQLYNIAQQQLEELQMLYSKVSSLEQLKSDMIRIAAHDLRNPLNVINTSIALIRRVDDEASRMTYLDQLQSAANQMKRIISDILSLERIEQMQDSEGELLDLNEMAAAVAGTFRMQAETKGQQLLLETANGNTNVQADPAQLREAVGNLLSNAIKYTPYDGLITVRVRNADKMIVLEVEDNGYGIPDDQQDKLFMPFQRAHSPETANIDGNGLGLYLIKNIVERFNGHTLFRSVYGEGSTFGFALPVADDSS